MENPAILLRRLNPYCARAMEGAASLCQTRAHAEILPEHWLLKLLEQGEGDLTVLARRYEWDMDSIWQDLLGWLDRQPRSVRQRPQLSKPLQVLMQEAWLIASLNGEEQIRSHHLLMVLVEKQSLARCDGLWPLLTLGRGQLDRLRPLLDAQSDERPELQFEVELAQEHGSEVAFVGRPVGAELKEGEFSPALQNALDKFTLDVTAKAREGKIDPVFGRDTEIRQMVDNHTVPEDESLSLTLTGTNGQLPRRALQSTVLDTVMKTTSTRIAVRNLCAPTLPCYPPAQDRFHWRVLSHLGSGFLSMMDNADVLRGTLALYEWTDSEMNRRRLEAIIEVKHSETERFEQGYLVRGVQIKVTLDSHGFAGRGDICLFGEMLSRFFALYTDIYLFNRLIIILQPNGERLEWQEKHNRRIPG